MEQGPHSNPEQERLAKRRAKREREFQEQINAHGGTGFPPEIDTIEACHQGICMKCGGQWDALHTHVWKHYPGLTMAEGILAYREEFQIPDDVTIDSDEHCRHLHDVQLARMSGPEGVQAKAQIAAALSRPRPDLYARTGNNRSGWNPLNWDIAKCLCSGMEQAETAKELGGRGNHKLVGRRGDSMGLTFGTSALCDHGEPFLNAELFRLRQVCGFETGDFEKRIGLSERRSQATRPPDSIVNPKDAGKVIKWRDEVARQLLSVATGEHCALRLGDKVFRQDDVLLTLCPGIVDMNGALLATMGDIRQELLKHPDRGMVQIGEFVCGQAAIEKSRKTQDSSWRKTLRYLCEEQSESWLSANLERLRGLPEGVIGPFVREMIGSRYGVGQQTIQNVLRARRETIEPSEMMGLISAHTDVSPAAGRRRGRQADATPNQIALAAALSVLSYSHPRMVPILYPQQHDKEAGRKAVQKFLKRNGVAIKKETANMTPEHAKKVLQIATRAPSPNPRDKNVK